MVVLLIRTAGSAHAEFYVLSNGVHLTGDKNKDEGYRTKLTIDPYGQLIMINEEET